MTETPLMPKATAVWLVENTTLTFKQIAEFCKLQNSAICLKVNVVFSTSQTAVAFGMNGVSVINYFFDLKLLNLLLYLLTLPLSKIFCVPPVQAK